MRNIKLVIEYDGTAYHGWQYQPNQKTIQGEVERVLKKIFSKKIKVVGAGRTDAGTHALGQAANFKVDSQMKVEALKAALNGNLPRDIFIKDITEVPVDFHARFNAKSRIYRYRIILGRSPLKAHYTWELKYKIDLRIMRQGLRKFIGRHDFTNFSVANEKGNRICNINKVSLTRKGDEVLIEIEGDRFLNRMVRMIVGFLGDLGRKQIGFEVTKKMFEPGFEKNFLVAPAQGLHLVKVNH